MTSPNITPRIQFATTSDGVRIAYATLGEGPPLVYMPEWVSHIEFEMTGISGPYISRLARNHTVLLTTAGVPASPIATRTTSRSNRGCKTWTPSSSTRA